jgi:hypothetical protein
MDDYGNVLPAETYRSGLSNLQNFVANWLAYTGTPGPETPELVAYHCKLRDGLVQLALMLTKTKDIPNRNLCIADLGHAGTKCGARWKGTIYQTLMLMKNGKLPTFIDLVYNEFSQLRFHIIHGMMKEGAHNVHMFNQLMSLVGEDLGLPGSEFLKDNVDHAVTYSFTKASVILNFMEKYTFAKKVQLLQQVLKDLFADITTRDMIFHWIRQNIPDDMLALYYDPIIDQVTKAVKAGETREGVQVIMKDIYWPLEEKNPLHVIAKARFEEFKERVVLDSMTGNFKLGFLVYMMLQLKIIKR